MVLEKQLLLLIFVNDVPDAIEALKLFLADDVKMAQNLSMQRSPKTTCGHQTMLLSLVFSIGLASPFQRQRVSSIYGVQTDNVFSPSAGP